MSESLGSAVLELWSDDSKLKTNLKDTESTVKAFGEKAISLISAAIEASTSSISKISVAFDKVGNGTVAFTKIKEASTAAAKPTEELASKIGDVADKQTKLGIAYEKALVAANMAAQKTRDIADALKLAAYQGTATQAEMNKLSQAYQKAGVDAQAANQKVRETGKALTEAGGSTVAYGAVVNALGTKMTNVAKKADDTGKSFNNLAQNSTSKAGEALNNLSKTIDGGLTKGLQKLEQGAINAGKNLLSFGVDASGKVLSGLKELVHVAGSVVGKFDELGRAAGGSVLGGISKLYGESKNLLGELTRLGSSAGGVVLEELNKFTGGLARVFTELTKFRLELTGNIIVGLNSVREKITQTAENLISFGGAGNTAATGMKTIATAAKDGEKATADLGSAVKATGSVVEGMGNSIHNMSALGVVAFGALAEAGRLALDNMIKMAERMKGLGEHVVSIAADYQQNMLQLKFLTTQVGESAQQTADRMAQFNKAAIEVGKTTSFSSKEATAAMAELAQMGYKTAEINTLIGSAANAAMINNMGLSEATNVLTSVMHGFGFQASESKRILDEMSRASQLGKISFADFGAEAENVGLIARAAGQSFEGVTAEMLALTNTGMSAARASETIRFALTQIEKPTAAAKKELAAMGLSYYDSTGHMKSFTEIAKEVQAKTAGMTEEQRNLTIATLFGKNGILAYNAAVNAQATVMVNGKEVILHGTDALKYWEDQLKNSNGTVQRATDILKTGFNFQMKNLKGSIDEAMISVGTALLPNLTKIIQQVTVLVNRFIDWEQKTHTVGNALNNILVQLMAVIPHLEKFGKSLEPLAMSLVKVWLAFNPLFVGLEILKGYLTGGIPGAIEATKAAFLKIEGYLVKGMDLAMDALRKYGPKVLEWILAQIPKLAAVMLGWADALLNWIIPQVPKVLDALGRLLSQVLYWVEAELPKLTDAFFKWTTIAINWALLAIPGALDALGRFALTALNWAEKEAPILAHALLKWTEILAGWIIPAIPGVISALEVVGAAIVVWGVTRLPQLIGQVIVGIGKGFGVNLQGPVNDVLMVFNSLVSNIRKTVIPAFHEMMEILERRALPLFDRLAFFISFTVIPTFSHLIGFLATTGVKVFLDIVDILGRLFGPALTEIGRIIREDLLPWLSRTYDHFDNTHRNSVLDMASALGEKLAKGIHDVEDGFKAAVPHIKEFYEKAKPIGELALKLWEAFSPLSIIIKVLTGFLKDGLNGAFQALGDVVINMGKVFGVDLTPIVHGFMDWVTKTAIPTIKEWGRIFIEDWWPKIRDAVVFVWDKLQKFWDFVSTVIWPPFKSFLEWMIEQWSKVGKSIGDTWENTIKPALVKFWDYMTNTLWPKLRDDIFPWIDKNVKPKLEAAFSIIADHIIPDIGKLIDVILNHVIPTLVAWWGVLALLVAPFLKTVGDFIGDITKGLSNQKDPLGKSITDFGKLADALKGVFDFLGKVIGGFHTLWYLMGGWLLDPIFKAVGNILTLIGAVGEAVDAFMKGDYVKVVTVVAKIAPMFDGRQIISGNGVPPPSAGQAALQQYMKDHPGYDPVAAGNAPGKATGGSIFENGMYTVGEMGPERVYLPKGSFVMDAMKTRQMRTAETITNNRTVNNSPTSNDQRSWNLHLTTVQPEPSIIQHFEIMKALSH